MTGNGDSSMELGALGVHAALSKAVMTDTGSEELAEATASAMAACAAAMPQGTPFPARAAPGVVAELGTLAKIAAGEAPGADAAQGGACGCATSLAAFQPRSGVDGTALLAAIGSPARCGPGCSLGPVRERERALSARLVADGSAPPPPVFFDFAAAAAGSPAPEAGGEGESGGGPPWSGAGPGPDPPASDGAVDVWAAGQAGDGAARPAFVPAGWRLAVQRLHVRMTSHDDVGAVLWPAAAVLGRWLVHHQRLLWGRAVLEVGAGMGLTGLVAAALARSVVVSDFHEGVLRNARSNIALNSGPECFERVGGAAAAAAAGGAAAACEEGVSPALREGAVRAQWLDWDALVPGAERGASCPEGFADASEGRFDVVIASDMVISKADCDGVARVCSQCLRPGGFGVFAVAPPDVRFGTEHLAPSLEEAGLTVRTQTVSQQFVPGAAKSEDAAGTAGGYEARIVLLCAVKPAV